jgi:hypothetical protein
MSAWPNSTQGMTSKLHTLGFATPSASALASYLLLVLFVIINLALGCGPPI